NASETIAKVRTQARQSQKRDRKRDNRESVTASETIAKVRTQARQSRKCRETKKISAPAVERPRACFVDSHIQQGYKLYRPSKTKNLVDSSATKCKIIFLERVLFFPTRKTSKKQKFFE
ncbi:MAG: hypothetical protein RSB10_05805, partial [Clostridia bacterium]